MVWQFWFALVSKPRKSIGLERRFDCQWPRDLLPCVSRPPAGRLLGRRHSWRRDRRCGSWEAPMTWRRGPGRGGAQKLQLFSQSDKESGFYQELWHGCLFTWVVHWWVSYIVSCQKSFHSICRAFNHKGKLAAPLAAKMNTTPAALWVQERAQFTASIWICNAANSLIKLKPWTFEL